MRTFYVALLTLCATGLLVSLCTVVILLGALRWLLGETLLFHVLGWGLIAASAAAFGRIFWRHFDRMVPRRTTR